MDVLLNWLVHGVLVAIAAAAGLRVMPASPAAARYGFIWAAYLLVLALPALPVVSMGAIQVTGVELASVPADPVFTVPAVWWTSRAVLMILLVVWSGIHGVQLAADAVALRRAKRHGRPCPRDVLTRLPHWSRVNAAGRPTRVVLSNDVQFAGMLGCGSPVIALAPGLIDQLSAADLDRVLVHEWAHVQRRDDVTQVVQRIVHAIVGWHPAAWWLERQLEFEREAACDEAAVAVTGSSKGYAACLATLAALPQAPVHSLSALAAVSPNGLRRRFVRILALPSVGVARPRRTATVCAAVVLAALALAVANVRAVAAVPTWTPLPTPTQTGLAEVAAIGVSPTSVPVVRAASPVSSVAPLALQSDRRARSTGRERDAPPDDLQVRPIEEPPTTLPSVLLPSMEWTAAGGLDSASLIATDMPHLAGESAPAPWAIAADAGVAMGKSSRNAGVATAGFFTGFGKRIARSF